MLALQTLQMCLLLRGKPVLQLFKLSIRAVFEGFQVAGVVLLCISELPSVLLQQAVEHSLELTLLALEVVAEIRLHFSDFHAVTLLLVCNVVPVAFVKLLKLGRLALEVSSVARLDVSALAKPCLLPLFLALPQLRILLVQLVDIAMVLG